MSNRLKGKPRCQLNTLFSCLTLLKVREIRIFANDEAKHTSNVPVTWASRALELLWRKYLKQLWYNSLPDKIPHIVLHLFTSLESSLFVERERPQVFHLCQHCKGSVYRPADNWRSFIIRHPMAVCHNVKRCRSLISYFEEEES